MDTLPQEITEQKYNAIVNTLYNNWYKQKISGNYQLIDGKEYFRLESHNGKQFIEYHTVFSLDGIWGFHNLYIMVHDYATQQWRERAFCYCFNAE